MKLTKWLAVALTVLVLGVSGAAEAAQGDTFAATTGLTEEQKAQIQLQIAQMKKDSPSATPAAQAQAISEGTRKEVSAWVQMGANMGQAIVGAAQQLGVAANDFAGTPLGKVTVAVVVYKLLGQDVLGLVYGTIVLAVGWSVAIYLLTRFRFSTDTPTYEYKPYLWGTWNRKVITRGVSETSDQLLARLICIFVMFALSTWIGMKIIF